MDDDDSSATATSPRIARPVPRRPFASTLANLMSVPTPPYDDSDGGTPRSASRCVDPSFTPSDTASLSRPQSHINLTSSTLSGIFSGAASGLGRPFLDRDELDSTWGAAESTPPKIPRRRSSYKPPPSTRAPLTLAANSISRALRASLLFSLGLGYGVLVTRLHSEQQYLPDLDEGIMKPGTNWRYLAFWGVAGVVLGSLLPWVDRRWEAAVGSEADEAIVDESGDGANTQPPGTDWALVMRAVGAFVGIMFAIRKLAWASTLQVSATLALVDPLLWWLIDRSKTGFLLAACVGLTGSVFMLGFDPDMMPAPSRSLPASTMGTHNISSTARTTATSGTDNGVRLPVLGGLASQETVETGVWMLSVLFCSCVCFGNIGRRLAWSRKAEVRGRWGGVR